jgi:hypothetical protein
MEGKDMVIVQDNAVPGTAVSAGVDSSARTGGGAHLRRRVR